jgi:hypothetical protein
MGFLPRKSEVVHAKLTLEQALEQLRLQCVARCFGNITTKWSCFFRYKSTKDPAALDDVLMLERSLDIASKLQATSSGVLPPPPPPFPPPPPPPLLTSLTFPSPTLHLRRALTMPQARHVQTINEKKQAMNANLTKTQASSRLQRYIATHIQCHATNILLRTFCSLTAQQMPRPVPSHTVPGVRELLRSEARRYRARADGHGKVCLCGCTLQPRFDACYRNLVCFTQVLEITCTYSVWRVGEGAAAAPAPASLPAAAPTRPSKSSPPPPSFRDLMRLDSTADDDAVPSPHAQPQTKHHALTDFDIDAPGPASATSVATAAASQGERLLRQMQEKAAAGQGHVVGAKVLMSKAYAMPAVKQVSGSLCGGWVRWCVAGSEFLACRC